MSVRPPPTDAHSTRRRILRAAERIFAQRGFRAMTLRDITRDANVNGAAVNYHFGSKHALIHEMVRARFEPINRERLRRLDELTAACSPDPVPLRAIVDALFRPLFEAARTESGPDQVLIQMIGRSLTEPADFLRELHREFFSELMKRVVTEIRRTLPDLPERELYYRLFFAIGTMISTAAEQVRLETISGGSIDASNVDGLVDRLIDFACGGLEYRGGKQG